VRRVRKSDGVRVSLGVSAVRRSDHGAAFRRVGECGSGSLRRGCIMLSADSDDAAYAKAQSCGTVVGVCPMRGERHLGRRHGLETGATSAKTELSVRRGLARPNYSALQGQ
jgi:hypothetical protein